jgi:hypothetical protein
MKRYGTVKLMNAGRKCKTYFAWVELKTRSRVKKGMSHAS